VAVIDAIGQAMVFSTETLQVGSGRKARREYNLPAMVQCLTANQEATTMVFLESVHAMPGQGVRSMFSMGKGFGIWLGILAALGLRYELVTPQAWKREMMAGMGREKDASRLRALQLFPQLGPELARTRDHGRADALLIAEYGRQRS
jgi:crossover junction endodeoxyribonuclease RuvC